MIIDHLTETFAKVLHEPMVVVGFLGQALFMSRFLVQWIASEKAKKSVIPVAFWYLSLAGATILLTYALYVQDPVFVVGQMFGFIVYIRNLALIKKVRALENAP
jgi:lipid-A-disaccharide synthase-like uncharacterized protein